MHFMHWFFSCLQAFKVVKDKLTDDKNFSYDGADVKLINLIVEPMRKLDIHQEAIEEETLHMLFQNDCLQW